MTDQENARRQTVAMRDLAQEQVTRFLAGVLWGMTHGSAWSADWEEAVQWDRLWRQLLALLGEPPPGVPPLGPEMLEELRQACER